MTHSHPNTTLDCLFEFSKRTPNKTCLVQPHNGQLHQWSWQEVLHDARCIASALQTHGVKPGDRVVIWSKNCAQWFIADYAIAMLGAVSVPVYPGQSSDSVHFVLDHSKAVFVIVGKQDDEQPVIDTLTQRPIPILAMPYYSGPANLQWQACIKKSAPHFQPHPITLDDLMTIVYTSGTTGNPKGVMHTYRSYGATCQMYMDLFNATQEHRFFSYLPLAHLAERIIVQGNSIYAGATVYFAESLDTFLDDIQRAQPTVFFAIPRIWEKFRERILTRINEKRLNTLLKLPLINRVIKHVLQRSLGLNKAEIIGCGAAPVSSQTLNWFDALNIKILEGYGMTENACYGSLNLPDQRILGSVGRPLPDCEIKLDNNNSEVLLKSPGLMTGYYEDKVTTASVFDEHGFYRTGDKGKIDDRGYVHIVGRLKEQFKSSKGKFIVPSKIERLLTSHPYLEQVCVFGSGMTQPVVAAQLSELGIAQDKAILLNQLTDFLRETNMQLEASERLESLWLSSFEWSVDNQLMTPTLKVKRHQVEELFKPYVVQKIQTESCNLITHISELQQVINHMHVKQN